MATAQTIIDRALRLIGAIASGESPTAQESADGLVALNAMIASWQAEKLNVYAYVETAYNTVAGTSSYTVGPSGNFNLTPRPPKLEGIFIRDSNQDYPIDLVDKNEWYGIVDKTTQSDFPLKAYYEPTLATGTLKVWPVPDSVKSLRILTWTSLVELATVGTTITLPQGYERALAYNLALEIAPEYEKKPSPTVNSVALESKAIIKRTNIRPILLDNELNVMFGGGRSDIVAGVSV